jgi:CBS domain-containing protein
MEIGRTPSLPHRVTVSRVISTGPDAKQEPGRAENTSGTQGVTIEEGASLAKAAKLMRSTKAKRLVVVNRDGHPVGTINRRDILKVFLPRAEALSALSGEAPSPPKVL